MSNEDKWYISGPLAIGTPEPKANLSVGGAPSTTQIETSTVLHLLRPVVPTIKNDNSVGLAVGAFEEGIAGRTRLDIKLSGNPQDSNQWGSIPDVTVMTLRADGNVGIGTANPVAGKLQFDNGLGNKVVIYDNGQTDRYGFGLNGGNLNAFVPAGGRFSIRQNGYDGTEVLAVTGTGNVGIGTTNPASGRLQFDNSLGNKVVIYDNGQTDRYGFGLNGGNLNAFVPAGGRFSIRQNGYDGTEVMAVTGTGDLTLKGNLFWSGDTSDSGYIILGTVQICWGNFPFPIPVHNNSKDVAFPHSFGKLPHVLISLNDPGAHPQEDREQSLTCGVGARGVTVSGFKAICKTSGNEDKRRIQCTWIAMGKA